MGAARFVISLDLEGYWGVRDHAQHGRYDAHLRGEHEASLRMLDVFDRYRVHATWATVGFMFAANAERVRDFLPRQRPQYVNPAMDPYADLDGTLRYDADLVAAIAAAPNQELATHTFSHFYCLEPGATLEAFVADIEAARAIGQAYGDVCQSIVFPRNQYSTAHLQALAARGVRAYRGNPTLWCYAPAARETPARRVGRIVDAYLPLTKPSTHIERAALQPVNVRATRFLRPYAAAARLLDGVRAQRINMEMSQVAKAGGVYHLWWHPHNFGQHLSENLYFLEGILRHWQHLHDQMGMRSATMAEVAAAEVQPTSTGQVAA